MTQQSNPSAAALNALVTRFDTLAQEVGLTQIANTVSEIGQKASTLAGSLADARRRGYIFAAYLESKIQVITERWSPVDEQVRRMLPGEAMRLRQPFDEVERVINAARSVTAYEAKLASLLPKVEAELEQAERLKDDAVARIKALYEPLSREISQTDFQIGQIKGMLDQRDEASFPFLADEHVFLVAKAEYDSPGRDDPEGLLFLTDQRLVFEQKETTGKKLGLFGGKKTQELEWEIPLHLIEKVEAENKGIFGGKDMLNFTFKSGAPMAIAAVEVKGGVQSKFWAAQIMRMIRGETNDERAIQPDAETLESLAKAPTDCPICGASLPMLVANQRQIACEFCGCVIRV